MSAEPHIPEPRRRVRRPFAVALVALAAFAAAAAPAAGRTVLDPPPYRMHVGSLEDCGDPDLDDSTWPRAEFRELPRTDGPLCLRTTVTIGTTDERGNVPLCLLLGALASTEIWWDGEKIGSAGTVGTDAASEVPGPIESLHVIPERLAAPGEHVLALRTSAFHRHFNPSRGYWYAFIADYQSVLAAQGRDTRIALITSSGIVMAGLFSLMLYAIDRSDRSFLFLALLCVTAAALAVAEAWRGLFGYTYDWHLLRLLVITGLAILLDFLLLVFLARRFPMSGARWFVGIGTLLAVVPALSQRSWDPKVTLGFFGVFVLAQLWMFRAVLQRRSGSVLAFLGLAPAGVMVVVNRAEFVESYLYVSLNILLLFLFASHVMQVRRVRQEREEARLKSARLELELLRRHIQPHFLMNTLTALAEWVDREPQIAAKMIQALSEEFRVLSDIADRDVIPVADEIRLCRCHLEIMSHRKGRRYAMATDGLDLGASIPPAVFHTLVENAITHNHYRREEVEFRLSARRDGDRTHYVFEAPLGDDSDRVARPEGTGLRYVRSRLREAFGQGWSLVNGVQGDLWRTEIVVPAAD